MDLFQKVESLNEHAKNMGADQIIRLAHREFGGRLVFASSLGEEDQVVTDLIANTVNDIEIFTLDTGRLFEETYALLEKTQKRYPMTFKVYYPDNEAVEDMVRNHGINLFYESVANRKLCCGIRKVEPLKRALKQADAWICGLRRAQSVARNDLQVFEVDEANTKIKISPLAKWSLGDVRAYIEEHKLDVSPLHARGFISIGCSCCTRAVKDGEDIRAGRWWWEVPEHKECGLHNRPGKK
jgi:phosphoadenosine phosphosulfate reductase